MPGKLVEGSAKLAAIPQLDISQRGTFKYILCKVFEGSNSKEYKYVIRGTLNAQFHSDIFDSLDGKLEDDGLTCECLGGGEMEHDPERKSIHIFGKSQGYGTANHCLTAQLLKSLLSDYQNITWSDT